MSSLSVIHVLRPRTEMQCWSYVLEGPSGIVLIDPGSGTGEKELVEDLGRLGFTLSSIQCVLLTHCHIDHAGMAYRFNEVGVSVAASPRTAEIVSAGGHQVWYEHPDCVIPAQVDLVLRDGQELAMAGLRVQVLHTPGHTAGCVTYGVESPSGSLVLFTGDLVTGEGHPGWAGSDDFSAEASLRSLERLMTLRADRAYWGHGPIDDVARWLARAIQLGREGQWKIHTGPGAVTVPAAFRARLRP